MTVVRSRYDKRTKEKTATPRDRIRRALSTDGIAFNDISVLYSACYYSLDLSGFSLEISVSRMSNYRMRRLQVTRPLENSAVHIRRRLCAVHI